MKMSFWAGALAGFMLGSTKQGCAVRKNMSDFVDNFFKADTESDTDAIKKVEIDHKIDAEDASEIGDSFEPGELDMAKATEMAQKLSANVSGPQGEESLPHSHQLHIPTNRLSA